MAQNANNHNVDGKAKLKRSTYPLHSSHHLSGEIGKLYPISCWEAVQGDTFHFSPNFNFRLAPTSLPLQTRMRFVIDYFFVPYQAIWEHQIDFFQQGMNGTIDPPVHPYLQMETQEAVTRNVGINSLGDYLGVPTVVPYLTHRWNEVELDNQVDGVFSSARYFDISDEATTTADVLKILNTVDDPNPSVVLSTIRRTSDKFSGVGSWSFSGSCLVGTTAKLGRNVSFDSSDPNGAYFDFYGGSLPLSVDDAKPLIICLHERSSRGLIDTSIRRNSSDLRENYWGMTRAIAVTSDKVEFVGSSASSKLGNYRVRLTPGDAVMFANYLNTGGRRNQDIIVSFWTPYFSGDTSVKAGHFTPDFGFKTKDFMQTAVGRFGAVESSASGKGASLSLDSANVFAVDQVNYLGVRLGFPGMEYDMTDGASAQFAAFGGSSPRIPLNALPFRAYECIYNNWYRNKDIDPLLENAQGDRTDTNGVRVTNRFLTRAEMASGPDTHSYVIRRALLEKDMFTSCLTEPLINYNPLIGIRQKANTIQYDFATSGGVVTVSSSNQPMETGLMRYPSSADLSPYTAQPSLYTRAASDSAALSRSLGSVITSYGQSIPEGDLSVMKDIIYTGITNADIYQAECLKRWISNKVQNGYNFSEQQMAQFGVNSRWNPLTSPIYIGGTAEEVNNGVVCNTAKSSDASLGELAGLPSCISSKENHFSYTADDKGIIMGIMRCVPIPIYSQSMPKFLSKKDYTDYFIPEFANKGWEAVKMSEVSPLQSAVVGHHNNTFAYQVPWHDYKSAVDIISGDMRTNFHDSVIIRDFATEPKLDKAFIECRSEDYEYPFVDTRQGDKFIGEIYTSCEASRPIPNYQDRTI